MVDSSSDGAMYDAFAADYLTHARDGVFNALYDRPAVLAMLGPVDGLAVLDVGCGPGLYAEELLARGARRVVGVDVSGEMVQLARQRVAGPVEFHRHDLQRPMPWLADAAFDVAVMPLVIHHLDNRVAALREIARVLRPGGRLVVSTHHPTGDWVNHGGSYFTVEKIHQQWRRGWQVAYWRQPLEASCDEFAAAGFLIERVQEPQPSAKLRERSPEDADWLSSNPGFIVLALLKR